MALLVLGMALGAIELFVIPGFGLIGVLGIASAVASVAVAVVSLELPMALAALGAGVAGGVALGWLVASSRVARSMVLEHTQRGGRATDARRQLVGAAGTAVTPLRPSGTARI